MWHVNDVARPHRLRACLMAIATVPALVFGLSACGNSAPPQPQVINDKGTPFGDLLVPKLTASVKDGANNTVTSKLYYRSRVMAFGQGFLPIIEHYHGDTFPIPPPPSCR